MDDKTVIEVLQSLESAAYREPVEIRGDEAIALTRGRRAIEALAKVRENIDAATTPADMIYALYAVTEHCAAANGPVQNNKVADMAAQVAAGRFLDPSTPMAEVEAEIRAAGGDPEAIGKRGAELVAGLMAKRTAQVFDPEKVRALLEAINDLGSDLLLKSKFVPLVDAYRAVRESEVKP